jgi:diguanylate cyclase (GGDEF)-like protein
MEPLQSSTQISSILAESVTYRYGGAGTDETSASAKYLSILRLVTYGNAGSAASRVNYERIGPNIDTRDYKITMPTFNDSDFSGSHSDTLALPSFAVVPFRSTSQRLGPQPAPDLHAYGAHAVAAEAGQIEDGLEHVERRERQLWVTLGGLSLVLTIGMVLLVLPQLMEISAARPEQWYLPRLFLGLVALMALLNYHLTRQRHTLRGTREALLREREQRQIAEAAAVMDPLTQSFNRRYLDDLMERELHRAKRLNTKIAFLMIDVDEFKSVNTRFGHIVGDTILREVADVIRKSVRASDTVVRYGGDEFLVVLGEAVELDAERVIIRIEHRVRDWNDACDIEGYQMGLSCGWSMHVPGAEVGETLAAADKKMYECKAMRRTAAHA